MSQVTSSTHFVWTFRWLLNSCNWSHKQNMMAICYYVYGGRSLLPILDIASICMCMHHDCILGQAATYNCMCKCWSCAHVHTILYVRIQCTCCQCSQCLLHVMSTTECKATFFRYMQSLPCVYSCTIIYPTFALDIIHIFHPTRHSQLWIQVGWNLLGCMNLKSSGMCVKKGDRKIWNYRNEINNVCQIWPLYALVMTVTLKVALEITENA